MTAGLSQCGWSLCCAVSGAPAGDFGTAGAGTLWRLLHWHVQCLGRDDSNGFLPLYSLRASPCGLPIWPFRMAASVWLGVSCGSSDFPREVFQCEEMEASLKLSKIYPLHSTTSIGLSKQPWAYPNLRGRTVEPCLSVEGESQYPRPCFKSTTAH